LQPSREIRPTTVIQETLDDLSSYLPVKLPEPLISDDSMPGILARSLSVASGWSYNPRSDRHSVIKCLGFLLDLAKACPRLRKELIDRDVVFGINTPVLGKNLDLAIGPPGYWSRARAPRPIEEIADQCQMGLPVEHGLQGVVEGVVKTPYLAVEAKAVMTDHRKALATLSDQLERFRHRVQGTAVTVGLVLVNSSDTFRSPGLNRYKEHTSYHRQPWDEEAVWDAVLQLPQRSVETPAGFDSMIVLSLNCPNDGTPVTIVRSNRYLDEIQRLATLYTGRREQSVSVQHIPELLPDRES
jgi:hypothetical protein